VIAKPEKLLLICKTKSLAFCEGFCFIYPLKVGRLCAAGDALKNIANALGVSSDALLNDETVSIKDIQLLKKVEVIQDMNEEDKALVTRFLDLTIRDYKAKKAYS